MVADSFQGIVRIYDQNGSLLTVGTADLAKDAELGTWWGTVQVFDGAGVAGKALTVRIAAGDGAASDAQLRPVGVSGDLASSKVVGLGPAPF